MKFFEGNENSVDTAQIILAQQLLKDGIEISVLPVPRPPSLVFRKSPDASKAVGWAFSAGVNVIPREQALTKLP